MSDQNNDAQNEKTPPYVDNLDCHEVFADMVQVLRGIDKDALRIEFCVSRCTQHPPIEMRCITPVGRFIIGAGLAKILIEQLKGNLADQPPADPPGVARVEISTKH